MSIVDINGMVDNLNKKFSGGHVIPSEVEGKSSVITWLDTGSFSLNKAINIKGRGLPTGHLVEMFGESASGKSLIALHVAKSCIDQGGLVVYFDVEGSFERDFAESLGIDTSKMILVQPTTEDKDGNLVALHLTDVFQRTESIIQDIRTKYGEDQLCAIILDSLASVNFEEDLSAGGPSDTQGRPEKRIKHWIRRIRPLVNATNTLWLIINQVYANITSVPTAQPLKTPGGKSVGFHSQIRVEWVSKKGKEGKVFDSNDSIIGARLHFKIDKNRVGPPWRTGYVDFIFEEDGHERIDYYSGYTEYLLSKGVIQNGKGKIVLGDGSSYQAKKEGAFTTTKYMEKMLEEHPELKDV